jgi:hypothetical protein
MPTKLRRACDGTLDLTAGHTLNPNVSGRSRQKLGVRTKVRPRRLPSPRGQSSTNLGPSPATNLKSISAKQVGPSFFRPIRDTLAAERPHRFLRPEKMKTDPALR